MEFGSRSQEVIDVCLDMFKFNCLPALEVIALGRGSMSK